MMLVSGPLSQVMSLRFYESGSLRPPNNPKLKDLAEKLRKDRNNVDS
jgi:hypothetical protein